MIGVMSTLTVQFADTTLSQSELQAKLAGLVSRLKQSSILGEPKVEPVFPGDESVRRKGVFVVKVDSQGEQIAYLLKQSPEVLQAFVAPGRR